MNLSPLHGPLIVGRPPMQAEFTAAPGAGALIVIVHPDTASLRHPGQRFIADVLQAHGEATLSFSLRTLDEEAAGSAGAGVVKKRERIFSVLGGVVWPSFVGRRIVLFGLGAAVPACIGVAARSGSGRLGALMLLDGRPDQASRHLGRLQVPTLLIVGDAEPRTLAHYRAAARSIHCPHRLQVLSQPTRPSASAGAHEAIVCAVSAWIDSALPSSAGLALPERVAWTDEPRAPTGPALQPAL